jgi:hypothetical protein
VLAHFIAWRWRRWRGCPCTRARPAGVGGRPTTWSSSCGALRPPCPHRRLRRAQVSARAAPLASVPLLLVLAAQAETRLGRRPGTGSHSLILSSLLTWTVAPYSTQWMSPVLLSPFTGLCNHDRHLPRVGLALVSANVPMNHDSLPTTGGDLCGHGSRPSSRSVRLRALSATWRTRSFAIPPPPCFAISSNSLARPARCRPDGHAASAPGPRPGSSPRPSGCAPSAAFPMPPADPHPWQRLRRTYPVRRHCRQSAWPVPWRPDQPTLRCGWAVIAA